jgi:hypothetical protein
MRDSLVRDTPDTGMFTIAGKKQLERIHGSPNPPRMDHDFSVENTGNCVTETDDSPRLQSASDRE